MRRLLGCLSLLLIGAVFIPAQVIAQSGTPEAVSGPITLVLIEHDIATTTIDGGETGPSSGDMIIWGPNPLFEEANSAVTGATTQGVCTSLDESGQCLLVESIIFADGSTIQLQGVGSGSVDAPRVIVGGSGRYLGATGTVTAEATADTSTWIKTFEIWM